VLLFVLNKKKKIEWPRPTIVWMDVGMPWTTARQMLQMRTPFWWNIRRFVLYNEIGSRKKMKDNGLRCNSLSEYVVISVAVDAGAFVYCCWHHIPPCMQLNG